MNSSNLAGRNRTKFAAALVAVCGAAISSQIVRAGPPDTPNESPAPAKSSTLGRRPLSSDPTVLAFKNVPVEQVVPFIVECTGKVVLPQQDVLSRRITLLNDQPIPRDRALDLVVLALQQAGIGVVETLDLVIIRDIAEITRQDVPVIGPEESLADRTDVGTVVQKVFALRQGGSAENLGKIIKDSLPDFAKYFVDADSNQLVVMANIALLQRIEVLVLSLDKSRIDTLHTETYSLRYADASVVAENIRELYSATAQTGAGQNRPGGNQGGLQQFLRQGQGGQGQRPGQGGNQRPGGGGAGGGGNAQRPNTAPDDASPSANLRVTANTQQNSVTVLAEPSVLEQIRRQVTEIWDRAVDPEIAKPRLFTLQNTDPIKVRDVLEKLLGSGTSVSRPGGAGGGGGGGGTMQQSLGRLAGQFSFEALPESNSLLVVSRSPDNLDIIAQFIDEIDKRPSASLPKIVELKHANAEELSEQLNTLLAQEGTIARLQRQQSGLSSSTSNISPFAADAATSTTGTNANQQNQNNTANTITYWWQQARIPTDNAGASSLVGKLRIVPVWRQNAVMVMAAPEYQSAIIEMIEHLDKPGRQVLISAVVAEVTLDDALELGLRMSSSPLTPTNGDNAIGGTIGSTNTKNDLLPGLFDTSVLNVNVNINFLLQALAQKTKINILSEPRIFTSDNQEAVFFDGQDIPFITDTQTGTNNNLIQSFDYRAVGIQLRARPRITVNRDVDLRVDLELSSIEPNQTLFGGFIVDRRQTTTQLIVKDNQTVVISGILRSQDNDVVRKVPLLGDIPLVGLLFTSTEKSKTKTEIVAFITPLVVNNTDENDELNVPYRKRLEKLREELTPDNPIPGVTPETPPPPEGQPPATAKGY